MTEKAQSSAVQPREARCGAINDQHVADIARILNQCLGMLDELGFSLAAAHLGAAINALPGQAAIPPIDLLDLIADFPVGPARLQQQFSDGYALTKPRDPR